MLLTSVLYCFELCVKLYCVLCLCCLPAIQKQLSMLKHGEGGVSVFMGLNGTKEELGLKADNYWIFAENNFDELYDVKLLFSFLLQLGPNIDFGIYSQIRILQHNNDIHKYLILPVHFFFCHSKKVSEMSDFSW